MEYQWHPAASIFPMMTDPELQELAADIKANGQQVPVMLDTEGFVIDGRNRVVACRIAGIEPQCETWCGESDEELIAFVISCNLNRRHLTSSQKAAAAANAEELLAEWEREARKAKSDGGKAGAAKAGRGRPNRDVETIPQPNNAPKSRDKAATTFGTNAKYIDAAKKLKKEAPDLFKEVESGNLAISQAKNKHRKQEQAKQLEQRAAKFEEETLGEQPAWSLMNVDVMRGLESILDQHAKARLVFADPPYNIGIDYGEGVAKDSLSDVDYMDWVDQWIQKAANCLTDDGSLWAIISDEYAAEYCIALKGLGLHVRAWIKWYETFGVNRPNNFNRTSRHIFYCVANPKHFIFNTDPVSRPSDRQAKYNDKRADSDGKTWDDVWQIPRLTGTSDERIVGFPTQLPLALVQPIIECCTYPGDLVVDPFNGSGTTGVAAISSGRRYIGIDISEEYISMAETRLKCISVRG